MSQRQSLRTRGQGDFVAPLSLTCSVCVYIYKPLCLAREEQQQLAEKKAQQAKNSELRTTMEAACTVLKTQETHAMTCGDACSLH